MVSAHIELMIDEKRKPTPMISNALRHGVCSVTPLNAKPTVNAAARLIAAMRVQNLREQIMLGYCRGALGGLVTATSRSPGTLTADGANRPPAASPPGRGAYSSMAICFVAAFRSPFFIAAGSMVIEAIVRIGPESSLIP